MSTSGRRDDAGPDEVEEETSEASLATEIEELKASLIGVPEFSDEWFRIKTDIKDKDTERLLLIEKNRCDDVVKEYFEENPQVLEAIPECPVCLEMIVEGYGTTRNICCGKHICFKCNSQGGVALLKACPLCRGQAPGSVHEALSITKEKADSGIAWAQTDMGECHFHGNNGVPQDVDKALSLFREAAEKGCTRAMMLLGRYYIGIDNYEEARRWYEAAATKGEMISLFHLGLMMKHGQAFDKNEQTRTQAFRFFTICAQFSQDSFYGPVVELSHFFRDSPPVMLHYLRPAVEGGGASAGGINNYALVIYLLAVHYYGKIAIFAPGYSPVPEAMFWYRQCNITEEHGADHPLILLERVIRERCAHCGIDLPEGKRPCCVECKAAYYCNRDCQVAHWKAGHKKECVKKLKKRLEG